MIAFSGVLNSWLIFAKNCDLLALAVIASSRADFMSSVFASISCRTSSDILEKAKDIISIEASSLVSPSLSCSESSFMRLMSPSIRFLASPSSLSARSPILLIINVSRSFLLL